MVTISLGFWFQFQSFNLKKELIATFKDPNFGPANDKNAKKCQFEPLKEYGSYCHRYLGIVKLFGSIGSQKAKPQFFFRGDFKAHLPLVGLIELTSHLKVCCGAGWWWKVITVSVFVNFQRKDQRRILKRSLAIIKFSSIPESIRSLV